MLSFSFLHRCNVGPTEGASGHSFDDHARRNTRTHIVAETS